MAASKRSQPATWFQLAPVWSTIFNPQELHDLTPSHAM
jgi:hypothetical protein